MHELAEVGEDRERVGALVVLVLEFGQRLGDLARHHGLEEIDHAGAVGEAERCPDFLGVHMPAAVRNRLIEQRERVTHRAFGSTGDERHSFRLDLHALLLNDAVEIGDHIGDFDAAQIETLATRKHGHRHLADFGGGEQEFDVRRRLFQRLEEAVEGRLREHVHLVDDVDLGARGNRLVARGFDDLADVVDGGVRRRIHLDHVDMAALDDRLAMRTEHGHVDRRAVDGLRLVVQRACENAGRGRLAHASDAGENIGLVNAVRRKRIGKRAHHRFLTDEIGEALRAILARENAIRAVAFRNLVTLSHARSRLILSGK